MTVAGIPHPRIVALCGLGGVGKTSVAVEYAHRHLADVGVAWQLAADSPAVLAAGMGELAAQLGARDVLDLGDPIASAHAALAAWPSEWLLLFDNAPDAFSLRGFLPPAGMGRVLITSQNPNWPAGQAMSVPVLDPEAAAAFLVSRTASPDRQAALELANELGGLPLALEQAAAYILASGQSLAGYRTAFRDRGDELLRRGEPIGYDKTVATTWAVAFARLEQDEPTAVGVLRLLACCAPDQVPLALLLADREMAVRLTDQPRAILAPLLGDSV